MKNFYKLSLALLGFVMVSGEPVFGSQHNPYRQGFIVEQTVKIISTNMVDVTPEDLIANKARVQLFSLTNPSDFNQGHMELDRLRKLYKTQTGQDLLSVYTALLVVEQGSQWVRGQLVCGTKESADDLAVQLGKVLRTGPHSVAAGTVSQPGFKLKEAKFHNWS